MAQAVTAVEAFVREIDEPVTKRFTQTLIISTTGANTDVTYDFGLYVAGSLGTFWTAVGADASFGQTALGLIQSIATLYKTYSGVGSPALTARTKVGAGGYVQFLSAASAGGAAAEPYTVTGLLSTDTVVAVTPAVATTNAAYIRSYGTLVTNGLTVTYNTDPGASGKVEVLAYRKTGTQVVNQGQYGEVISNGASNITFNSGDAPTSAIWYLTWDLLPGCHGVKY